MEPYELLKNAVSAVPAMKYALAVVGLLAVIAIVVALKIDFRIAVFGSIIIIVLMVVLLIFARLSSIEGEFFSLPALVLTWFCLILIMAVLSVFFTSIFFQKPIDLSTLLIADTKPQDRVETLDYTRVYYESFRELPAEDVELEPIWLVGEKDDWRGEVVDGRYKICNIVDSSSSSYTSRLTYRDRLNKEIDLGDSRVKMRVSVSGNTGKYSGAGILYRMQENESKYYALVLQAGETVSVYYSSEGEIKILWSEDVSQHMVEDYLDISMNGLDSAIEIFVNNQKVHAFEDTELITGSPGVFAYSTGCFFIDNMSVFRAHK